MASKVIRLNAKEEEELRRKAIEINRQLVRLGKEPMQDSKLLHEVLVEAIRRIEVTAAGEVRLGGK